jgi:monoamine oxidase
LGAQVLHGHDNPVRTLVSAAVLEPPPEVPRVVAGGVVRPMSVLAAAGSPPWAVEARLTAQESPPADSSVRQWLGGQPLQPGARAVAAEWFRQTWAGEPHRLCVRGVAEAGRNDRVGTGRLVFADGFDALPAALAEGLPVRLGTPVRDVSWRPGRARLRLAAGSSTADYQAVVVTVPPRLVAAGDLTVDDLPPVKMAAAGTLTPGDGWCASVLVDRQAPDSAVVFDADGLGGFIRSTAGSPRIRVVAKARSAARLRAMDQGLLLVVLRRALPWLGAVIRVDAADWGADPWARGVFCYPRPGGDWAGACWAAPVGDTVFFAGEATGCGQVPPTVHNAIGSGHRAADEVLAVMSR